MSTFEPCQGSRDQVLQEQKKRIGIFGGTFDPLHLGHLILAEEARHQLQLDCIYLVPAADPPHKQNRQISSVEHRIRMAELATLDNVAVQISRIDADRPGPHFTVDTIRLLHKKHQDAVDLFFLMGLDSLRDLPTWHKPLWLVEHCTIVALNRFGVEIDWQQLEDAIPNIRQSVVVLDMPALEIASHDLRQRVRDGNPIRYQVPQVVERYIADWQLYTCPEKFRTIGLSG